MGNPVDDGVQHGFRNFRITRQSLIILLCFFNIAVAIGKQLTGYLRVAPSFPFTAFFDNQD